MTAPRDWRTWALLIACALPFVGFWATGLTDLDEGFYGAVVSDMVRNGDWITPTLNGQPWFEKPILIYWLAIPSVSLFGEAVGPRLPSVLCTLATALVLFRFLRRHISIDVARVATAAYCGSLMVAGVGRMMLTDAPLVLALTIAFTTFWDSLNGSPKMRVWTAVALGFAVLAKGPVAGLLFVLVASFTYWRMPDLRPNFKGHWLPGISLFAIVVGAWYVPCYIANGQTFVQDFLIDQNIGRFSGGDEAHAVPWWSHPFYHPAVLFLAVMPWSWWALKARWFERPSDPLRKYLWIWVLVVLGFFTASGTKLPHYALPAVAPLVVLAVLAAMERREHEGTPDFWLKAALVWSALVGVLVTTVLQLDYQKRFAEVHALTRYVREHEGSVVYFKIGRPDSKVEISTSLNEGAHPSALFYLNREATMTDDIDQVLEIE
ncbi:MAG: glycosyltransferase family 39 protein, partial [Armatimonadetes bacterium]|nr:glycosyltransferase family 39 protein [Armatimonadota bacterium]